MGHVQTAAHPIGWRAGCEKWSSGLWSSWGVWILLVKGSWGMLSKDWPDSAVMWKQSYVMLFWGSGEWNTLEGFWGRPSRSQWGVGGSCSGKGGDVVIEVESTDVTLEGRDHVLMDPTPGAHQMFVKWTSTVGTTGQAGSVVWWRKGDLIKLPVSLY